MELPRLEPLFRKYRDQGFNIIAVDGRADTERAQKLIADNDLSFTLLENGEGEHDVVGGTFNVRSYPTAFIIDGEGRILYYHLGFSEGDEDILDREIAKVLSL